MAVGIRPVLCSLTQVHQLEWEVGLGHGLEGGLWAGEGSESGEVKRGPHTEVGSGRSLGEGEVWSRVFLVFTGLTWLLGLLYLWVLPQHCFPAHTRQEGNVPSCP